MKEGYFIAYPRLKGWKIVEIDEHERWLRSGKNAKTLGVPAAVRACFGLYKSGVDRDRFLRFVMKHSRVIRVRGHGEYVTCEFHSRSIASPLRAIKWWAEKVQLGPMMRLNIVNLATDVVISEPFGEFRVSDHIMPSTDRETR